LWVRPELALEWNNLNVPHLGRLLDFPTNIGLGWKGLSGTTTLSNYENSQITTVKSFTTLDLDEINLVKGDYKF
jgi:hypothetical protein